jgi:membrane protease YdiL (CAAX protease family)
VTEEVGAEQESEASRTLRPPVARDPSLAPHWKSAVWPLPAQLVALVLLQVVVLAVSGEPDDGEAFYHVGTALSILGSYVVLAVAAWIAASRSGPPRLVLGLVRTRLWRAVGLVVVAWVVAIGAALILEPIFHGAESQGLQPDAFPGGAAASIGLGVTIVAICVVGPFAEELYFRGLIYGAIRPRGAVWATIGAALIFSAAHLTPRAIPVLFVLGAVLALLYEKTGSIWPAVAFHMLNNSLAMVSALGTDGSG